MTEVKTFKIEQKFDGTEDLYQYIIKNVKFIGESIGIKIQKPLKDIPFCITGKKKLLNETFYSLHQKMNILRL